MKERRAHREPQVQAEELERMPKAAHVMSDS